MGKNNKKKIRGNKISCWYTNLEIVGCTGLLGWLQPCCSASSVTMLLWVGLGDWGGDLLLFWGLVSACSFPSAAYSPSFPVAWWIAGRMQGSGRIATKVTATWTLVCSYLLPISSPERVWVGGENKGVWVVVGVKKEPGSVCMGSKSAWQFPALSQSLFDYPTPPSSWKRRFVSTRVSSVTDHSSWPASGRLHSPSHDWSGERMPWTLSLFLSL